jgi:hypothetical protein
MYYHRYIITFDIHCNMATMPKEIDYKIPVGVSLPQSMIKEIDEKRGRLGRSSYILLLLEEALRGRKPKVA